MLPSPDNVLSWDLLLRIQPLTAWAMIITLKIGINRAERRKGESVCVMGDHHNNFARQFLIEHLVAPLTLQFICQ
jgi:hypothetical protein